MKRKAIDRDSEGQGDIQSVVPNDVDLVEWYYRQGYSDGFPVVPPTPAKVEAMVDALGGDAQLVEARVPPRWGTLTARCWRSTW